MWHASISYTTPQPEEVMRAGLRRVLSGVGMPIEWVQEGNGAIWHCRRRLTTREQAKAGAPLDIRGTLEHRQRATAARQFHPLTLEKLMEYG